MKLKDFTEGWKLVVAIVAGCSLLIASAFGIENHYATKKEIKLIAIQIDQKIKNDEITNAQNELYRIMNQYGCKQQLGCEERITDSLHLDRYRKLLLLLNKLYKGGVK